MINEGLTTAKVADYPLVADMGLTSGTTTALVAPEALLHTDLDTGLVDVLAEAETVPLSTKEF